MKGKEKKYLNDQPYSMYLDSDEPVFILNKKGELINVNDAFCKKLGLLKKDILGSNLQESSFLTQGSQRQVSYRQIAKLIGKEAPFYELDVRNNKGDILSLDIETQMFSEDGEVAGEIGIVKNIRKSKKISPKKKEIMPDREIS